MLFLLADDHSLFCEGMGHILQMHFSNTKITQASSWYDTHKAIARQQFDLAFIDLTMPGHGYWCDELNQVLITMPNIPVCVISAADKSADRRKVYELGAAGFFHKSMSTSEVIPYIKQLLAGQRVFPNMTSNPLSSPLTVRQRDIMHLLQKGYCNKEIAHELSLTENTIKRHFHTIFKTLGAKNRVDALQIMQEQHW